MIIDPSGRGPTMRQLIVAGVGLLAVIAGLVLLMMRYTGQFENTAEVTAISTTTGDGLLGPDVERARRAGRHGRQRRGRRGGRLQLVTSI